MMTRMVQGAAVVLTGFLGLAMASLVAVLTLPFWFVHGMVRVGRRVERAVAPTAADWQELVQYEPVVGWKPKPGIEATARGSRPFRVTTDPEGWRGGTRVEEADLVVFGDSFAFGHGAGEGEHYADLVSEGRVKAVGANGYSLVQGLLWMDRYRDRLAGKRVVWFVYYGNDLLENLRPHLGPYRMPFVREAEEEAWEIVTEHVREDPWPFDPGRDYHRRLAEICTAGTLLSRRAFGAAEWLIRRGAGICSDAGATLAVFGIPDVSQISRTRGPDLAELVPEADGRPDPRLPDRRLEEICGRVGVPFVALADHLVDGDHQQGDCHWTRSGHRKVAALLDGMLSGAEAGLAASDRAPSGPVGDRAAAGTAPGEAYG